MIETAFLTAIINPKRSKQFEQFFIENKTPGPFMDQRTRHRLQ